MLGAIIDFLQAKLPPARMAALLTALVTPFLTAGAAWLAPWAAQNLPGLPVYSAAQLTAIAVAAVLSVLITTVTVAYKWIDGQQKHEARLAANPLDLALIESATHGIPAAAQARLDGLPAAAAPPVVSKR